MYRVSVSHLVWIAFFVGSSGVALGASPDGLPPELTSVENPVVVVLKPAVASTPFEAKIHGRPVSSEGADSPFTVYVQVPGRIELPLPSGTVWQLSSEAEGYWSRDETVSPGPGGAAASFLLWPTAEIRGRLEPPRNEAMPQELGLRFEPSPGSRAEGHFPRSLTTCPTEETGAWSCRIPAVGLDLRLRATGFVSHYVWDAQLQEGRALDLGAWALRRGGSVVGRIEALDGREVDPQTSRVDLVPSALSEDERLERLKATAEIDERGFFHFEGVAPGSYDVVATRPGSVPARYLGATVMQNAETELRDPLVFFPPLTFEVHVSPPVDYAGDPWQIQLVEVSKAPGVGKSLGMRPASAEGIFKKEAMSPGKYYVSVKSVGGESMKSELFELTREKNRLDVALDLVLLEGSLMLGGEPLAADLLFGGPNSPQRVEVPSDDEGRFFGMLPRDGDWKILVHAEEMDLRRYVAVEVEPEENGIARLELGLPDTRLLGTVVDERDEPVEGALVRFWDSELDQTVTDRSDPEGRVSFRGLPTGSNRVVAEHVDGRSNEVEVELVEDRESEVRLVLRRHVSIAGEVRSVNGPLPGVLVDVFPFDDDGRSLLFGSSHATTDVEGKFQLETSSLARSVRVFAYAPGYALVVLPPRTLEELAEQPLHIEVEASRGTVTLAVGEDAGLETADSSSLQLFVSGQPVGFGVLQEWRRIHDVHEPEGTTYTIPALPPGPVTACWGPSSPVDDPAAGCKSGFVGPDSRLALNLGSPTE